MLVLLRLFCLPLQVAFHCNNLGLLGSHFYHGVLSLLQELPLCAPAPRVEKAMLIWLCNGSCNPTTRLFAGNIVGRHDCTATHQSARCIVIDIANSLNWAARSDKMTSEEASSAATMCQKDSLGLSTRLAGHYHLSSGTYLGVAPAWVCPGSPPSFFFQFSGILFLSLCVSAMPRRCTHDD